MKISFIGGSLEPGKDGVGDYLRRLAAELERSKHVVTLIALQDGGVSEVTQERQVCDGVYLNAIRLPAASSWEERVKAARAVLDDLDPDWVSFHFVPFAFQRKGLPTGLGPRIRRIAGARPLHIMFHELWVGLGIRCGLKMRAWGCAQRQLIKRLAAAAGPKLVHTSNRTYANALAGMGVEARILPVFSNIPVAQRSGWLEAELTRLIFPPSERNLWLLLGVFGAMHDVWSNSTWWPDLVKDAQMANLKVALLGIGKVSPLGLTQFNSVAAAYGARVKVHHFGAQSAENISDFLQTIDGGISTAPYSLLDKSTAAAAMREHRVPFFAPRGDDIAGSDVINRQVRAATAALVKAGRTPRMVTPAGSAAATALALEKDLIAAGRTP